MDPLAIYQWLYEKTDGRFTWLAGLPVLLLRTTGAKTGKERTAALVYLKDGDNCVVVASNGGSDKPPGWYFEFARLIWRTNSRISPATRPPRVVRANLPKSERLERVTHRVDFPLLGSSW